MSETRCEHCIHYRPGETYWGADPYCALSRPLIPCDQYEREPRADDGKGDCDG